MWSLTKYRIILPVGHWAAILTKQLEDVFCIINHQLTVIWQPFIMPKHANEKELTIYIEATRNVVYRIMEDTMRGRVMRMYGIMRGRAMRLFGIMMGRAMRLFGTMRGGGGGGMILYSTTRGKAMRLHGRGEWP